MSSSRNNNGGTFNNNVTRTESPNSRALSTLTECPIEKQKILHTPFGGLHVILVGDFYQLRCVKGTPLFSNNIQSEKA
jgi:hypothetical protein